MEMSEKMKVSFKDRLNNVSFLGRTSSFISKNAASLSMVGSILSFGISLYSAFKASDKVAEIHKDYLEKAEKIESKGLSEPEKAKELKELRTVRNIHYVDAEKVTIVTGFIACCLSFASNYINGITITGLSAFAISQKDKLQSIAAHAKEMIGEDKFKEIENKSLEELVMKNFVYEDGESKGLTARALYCQADRGENVFLDTESGAMFLATEEELLDGFKWAENEVARNGELTQDKWCEHVGYPKPDEPINKCRAWTKKNPFKAHLGVREDFLGMTIRSVEFDNKAQPIDKNGVPWKV